MSSETIQNIQSSRVARFNELRPFPLAYVDSLLPDGRKTNLRVIGQGSVENPRMRPPIAGDHGFTVGYVLVPPGGGASLHSHTTAEVFIAISGPLTVIIGDEKEQLLLQPLDVCSVPAGVMRGFRNFNHYEVTMMILAGGHTAGGSVTWHDDVLRRAAETGLGLDEKGKLRKLPNFKQAEDAPELEF